MPDFTYGMDQDKVAELRSYGNSMAVTVVVAEDRYSNFISDNELNAILSGTHEAWLENNPAYITPVEGV